MKKKELFKLGEVGKKVLAEIEAECMPGSSGERLFLEAFCRMIEVAADANAAMKRRGTVQTHANKTRQVSPEYSIFKNAINDAKGIAKDMPKIREGLGSYIEKKEEGNRLSIVMKKRANLG